MVLVDKLLISLDIFDDILSSSNLPREDDDLRTSLPPGLIQQSQDKGSVLSRELVSESPGLQLRLVLLHSGSEISRCVS